MQEPGKQVENQFLNYKFYRPLGFDIENCNLSDFEISISIQLLFALCLKSFDSAKTNSLAILLLFKKI